MTGKELELRTLKNLAEKFHKMGELQKQVADSIAYIEKVYREFAVSSRAYVDAFNESVATTNALQEKDSVQIPTLEEAPAALLKTAQKLRTLQAYQIDFWLEMYKIFGEIEGESEVPDGVVLEFDAAIL